VTLVSHICYVALRLPGQSTRLLFLVMARHRLSGTGLVRLTKRGCLS